MKRTNSNVAKVKRDTESGLILAATRVDPANEDRLADFLDEKMLHDSAKLLLAYGEDLGSLMDMIDIDMPSQKQQAIPSAIPSAVLVDEPLSMKDADLQSGIQIGLEEEGDGIQIGLEDDVEDIRIADVDMGDTGNLVIAGNSLEDETVEETSETFSLSNIPESMPDLNLGDGDLDLDMEETSDSEQAALPAAIDIASEDYLEPEKALSRNEIVLPDEDDFEVVPVTEEQLEVNAQISAHIREDGQNDEVAFEDALDVLNQNDDITSDLGDEGLDDDLMDLPPETGALAPEPDEVADLSGEIDFSDLMQAEEESETSSLIDMLRPSSLPEPKPAGFSDADDWLTDHMSDLGEDDPPSGLHDDTDPLEDRREISMFTIEEPAPMPRVTPSVANIVDFGEDPLSIMDEPGDDMGNASKKSGDADVKNGVSVDFGTQDAPEAAEGKDGVRMMGIFKKTPKDTDGSRPDELQDDGDAGFALESSAVMNDVEVRPDAEGDGEFVGEMADTSAEPVKKSRSPLLTVLLGTAVAAVIGLSVFAFLQGKGSIEQTTQMAPPVSTVDVQAPALDPSATQVPPAPSVPTAPSTLPGDTASGEIPAAGDVAPPVANASDQTQDLDRLAKDLEAAKNGDLSDLFDKEAAPAAAVEQGIAVTQDMIDGFATKAQTEEVKKAIDLLFEQLKTLEGSVAEKDQRIATLEQALNVAASQAQKAEALALAQNEVLVEFVRVQEKVDMAESLIVDLSKRIAKVETTDPADRVAVERSLDDLNSRIEGIARDIGLIARMSINGSPAAVKPSTGASAETPSVPGADSVYEEVPSDAQPASGAKGSVPSDVKVGDFVEGYGYVLDIISTSDGSRLVVMENGSVLIS